MGSKESLRQVCRPRSQIRASRPKVLVIHREASVCSTLRRWLEDEGYACRTATSHLKACELLDRESFSALVVGVEASGTSELTFLLLTRYLFPAMAVVPIVFREREGDLSPTLGFDADGLVLDPLERDQMTVSLAAAIRRRQRASHAR